MRKDLFAVLLLGFAFFTVFSAFNCQGFIEIAVLRNIAETDPSSGLNANSGYYSLSIIYLVFTFCNLFAPGVLNILGTKWSQVVGALCYSFFMLSFLHLQGWLLYLASGILGFGAAILWTANGVYLTQISREGKMERNSGIMWAMLQSSYIAGAMFLLFVLKNGDMNSSYRLIYTVFTALSVCGTLLLACLPSPPPPSLQSDEEHLIDAERGESEEDEPPAPLPPLPQKRSLREELKNTFQLLKTKQMMTLSVVFMYTGFEITFLSGVYSACLSATNALTKDSDLIIPYNAFAMGIGQIIGSSAFGIFVSKMKVNRSMIIIFVTAGHILSFFLCFINIPSDAPIHKTAASAYIEPSVHIALITGLLLGLCDAGWNTQIYVIINELYKKEASSAFALFKFFQSAAAALSFYYGSMLLLHWQLLILTIFAASGAICYFQADNAAILQRRQLIQ